MTKGKKERVNKNQFHMMTHKSFAFVRFGAKEEISTSFFAIMSKTTSGKTFKLCFRPVRR
ncbi:MAG: hypothetical protein FWD71_09940 [Oscillospiraceae bacterium]|nr:hypothetical protein [Oscillospiraceae bacterium]